MKRFTIGLWKEWRDHRGVLLGLLGAIPVLTFLGFWAFSEEFERARVWSVAGWFLCVALVLLLFSVAADLVAGETRRGTMALVRRLPRAMGSSFVVKLSFLIVAIATVTVVQMCSLATAWAVFIGDGREHDVFGSFASFPEGQMWAQALGVALLMAWTLVTSTWLGRSGAAAVASFLVLALIGLPWALLAYWHPYFIPFDVAFIPATVALFSALAIAVAAVSYLRGLRFHAAAWRPAAYGAVCLLIITGASYGYAQVQLNDWLDIDPHDEDFAIYEAFYGEGGEKLFLNVHRGTAWWGGDPHSGNKGDDKRGTPIQMWIVDLESGAITKQATDGYEYLSHAPGTPFRGRHFTNAPCVPTPLLVSHRIASDKVSATTYWDAKTGEVIDVLAPRVQNAKTQVPVRRALRLFASKVDDKGRPVWIRNGVLEREGEEPALPDGLVASPAHWWDVPVPDGWHTIRHYREGGNAKWKHVFIDKDTGEESDLDKGYGKVLSRDWVLQGSRPEQWQLTTLGGGEKQDVKNPPAFTIDCVGRNTMLALRGPKAKYQLELWNPVTGATRDVAWPGVPSHQSNAVWVTGRDRQGRPLLRVRLGLHAPFTRAYGVLDVETATVRVICQGVAYFDAMAIDEDGSLVGLEDQKRVVRYGPQLNEREVLFPR